MFETITIKYEKKFVHTPILSGKKPDKSSETEKELIM